MTKRRRPPQQEGLAWLAYSRQHDCAGFFRAIVICDIKVGGGEDFDGYTHSFFIQFLEQVSRGVGIVAHLT